ncbi:type VI secretion protein [Meridianimarinicoccus roseus]|uniref:Type VI secretion protein n=1 Tax=Meridianimarinicoccus roseus TaxID=2072018 RepID=A0A2V2L6Q1_9RHOB|nr:PAAR domain-containing protein [Meridianimarinicoccus roseus]PWR01042.1 type VI secretion protein [Meridianimarinicoccus roseus]
MPPAARLGDFHACPMTTGLVPHVGGPVMGTAATVMIEGAPAATVGDTAVCVGPPDTLLAGSGTVRVGGKPAVRMGDSTAHGGTIALGAMTVLIGD